MERGDRRLDLVRAGASDPERAVRAASRPSSISARSQRLRSWSSRSTSSPVRPGPRLAPGVVQEHQREQAERLGLVGHELGEDARQADRLARELAPNERLARRRAVALVEDQVQDPQDARRGAPGAPRAAAPGTGSPASRIFRFARTSRCASVTSGTRKARAISGVVSPPSVRSVSATRASGASAGMAAREDQAQPVVDAVRLDRLLPPCPRSSPSDLGLALQLLGLLGQAAPAPDAVDRRGSARSS